MKSYLTLALAALAAATPAPLKQLDEPGYDLNDPSTIENQQAATTGIISNEFTEFGCRPVVFIFARGSTELGNMGTVVGPQVSDGLKSALGATNVATEGVDYAALLSTNNLSTGSSDLAGIQEMADLLKAAAACPNTKVVAGGYSQGAALTHRSIENLPSSVKDKIVGVVTFGDTQNAQDNGAIPNFPSNKLKIFCNVGDLVCARTLIITAAHLTYGADADEAADFLLSKIGSV